MIAVQVLSQTVSNTATNTESIESETSAKSVETTDVVSYLQEQMSAGTHMYSLQISGQTIPLTTIQLPMLQQTQHQPVSTSSATQGLQHLTEDISATISTLGVSTAQLELTCTPEKDRISYGEGKRWFSPLIRCLKPIKLDALVSPLLPVNVSFLSAYSLPSLSSSPSSMNQ